MKTILSKTLELVVYITIEKNYRNCLSSFHYRPRFYVDVLKCQLFLP